jgi:ABC-type branched-subunit amino acid transport system ATPase component
MGALLQIANVVTRFGSVRVHDGVSLAVEDGTITGLIGPNGAGKTTLFSAIAGTLRPESGSIHFGLKRIDGEPPDRIYRLGLARTFQIPRPFPGMTVLENAMLAPVGQAGERFWRNWIGSARVSAEETRLRTRAMEILGFAGLADKAGDLAGQLSGGQQKLLELARILMSGPRLILLDEPAAGVNPALIDVLVDKIVQLNKAGTSFLVIEHNMDVVMSLCRPIVVMAEGRVIFEGDGEGARRDPKVLDAYLGDLVP